MGRGVILGLMTEVTIYYVNHTLTFYFTDFHVMMMNKQLTNFFLRFPQSCPPPPLKKKKKIQLIYNVVFISGICKVFCYTHRHILFQILFHIRLLNYIEYNSVLNFFFFNGG